MRVPNALACLAPSLLLLMPIHRAAAQDLSARIETCAACHGANGVSEQAGTPSLAGQPAGYTVVQLYMFRERLRMAEPMNEVARDLSDADLQALADHFAALPPPPPAGTAPPEIRRRGAELAQAHRCGFCHTADFSGQDQVPRIAHQREDYLAKALADYKSGTRPGYDPAMSSVMAPVTERDIEVLARFLATAQ